MSTWNQIDAALAIIARDHLCHRCAHPLRGPEFLVHDDPWAAKACAGQHPDTGPYEIPGVDFRPHGQNVNGKCECELCALYDAEAGACRSLLPEKPQ